MSKRVCHLTTVHQPFDVRIFLKECRALASAGYETHLVATHDSDVERDGVKIHGLPRASGRVQRMFLASRWCLKKAVSLDADLYHFHDPELIPVGRELKKLGKTVVYDVHESYAESVLDREYIPLPLRQVVSDRVARAEARADRELDAIVAATPRIARSFANQRTVLVQNFPILGELASATGRPFAQREAAVCFVGNVSRIRGAREMVEAIRLTANTRLVVAGDFTPAHLSDELGVLAGWGRVDRLGFVDRSRLSEVMGRCIAGLVPFHPLRNHIEAQPNKLFEYMSAGLPVIVSDFPYWRETIEREGCGLLVDPMSPEAIAGAIESLVNDRQGAQEMGARGAVAVKERYNWEAQERILLDLYGALIGSP